MVTLGLSIKEEIFTHTTVQDGFVEQEMLKISVSAMMVLSGSLDQTKKVVDSESTE